MDPKDYPHPRYWVLESDGDFKDFLSIIIMRAPYDLNNPSLSPERQLTLEIAFDILRAGADLYCRKRKRLKGQEERLNAILDTALAYYHVGDGAAGGGEIYRFEVAIFGHIENGKRTYEYDPDLDVIALADYEAKKDGKQYERAMAAQSKTTVAEIAGLGEIANFKDAYEAAKSKFGPDGKGGG
jgi:hypothetical protein